MGPRRIPNIEDPLKNLVLIDPDVKFTIDLNKNSVAMIKSGKEVDVGNRILYTYVA